MKVRRFWPVCLVPLIALACGGRQSKWADVKLPTVGSAQDVALKSCPTPKCLTVMVAPWCHYCRGASPMIMALRDYLKNRNVTTRVVVGQDSLEPVRDYAKAFGPDTLVDLKGQVPTSGVPYFVVSDSNGRILRAQSGAPGGVEAPFTDDLLAKVAALYGLP